MSQNTEWQRKIEEYCREFNLPIDHLVDTLREPKVIPMIRGKSFEFSAVNSLKKVLSDMTWDVTKTPMNAQQGSHDVDVLVTHKPTGTKIRVECKLAGKGRYRFIDDNHSDIGVKCMRSRTLGTSMVATLAPQFGVTESQLAIHNDQYLPTDFDVVLTSIANAFYITDPITEQFVWNPSGEAKTFLSKLSEKDIDDLQSFTFNQMYLTKTTDIVISKNTGIKCTRRACTAQDSCGFIPNYPVIKFENVKPTNNWSSIGDAEAFFTSLVQGSRQTKAATRAN